MKKLVFHDYQSVSVHIIIKNHTNLLQIDVDFQVHRPGNTPVTPSMASVINLNELDVETHFSDVENELIH